MQTTCSSNHSSGASCRPRRHTGAVHLLAWLTLLLAASAPEAATVTVDSLGDTVAEDGQCTLREAWISASTDADVNADLPGCRDAAAYGSDTILFALGGSILLGSKFPDLEDPAGLLIDGTGRTITIDGQNSTSALRIEQTGVLELRSLTFARCFGQTSGSALINLGQSTVSGCTFTDNRSPINFVGGGAITSGGFNTTTLAITDSTFTGNQAANGGAMYLPGPGARVTIRDSSFIGNISQGLTNDSGGAIRVDGSFVTISGCTFGGNEARSGAGGAIYNAGITEVYNSTFSGNTALTRGGGIFSNFLLSLVNVTVFSNAAPQGGNLRNEASFDPSSRLRNTIVAGAGSGGACSGTISDLGQNLDDDGSCGLSAATGSKPGAVAGLDPAGLQDNGGPTLTIALVLGSEALDMGDPNTCADPNTVNGQDQRGFTRPTDGDAVPGAVCDIGAFEAPAGTGLSPTATATPSLTPTSTPSSTATITSTPTDTPTVTATSTVTTTSTSTPTDTPTVTATSTVTSTSTSTPTDTPTETATSTPTSTPTDTPTETATSTVTSTPTDTPTVTATSTVTSTSTSTPTDMPTETATSTVTSTSTPTATASGTSTGTPALPATVTATGTASRTATPGPTTPVPAVVRDSTGGAPTMLLLAALAASELLRRRRPARRGSPSPRSSA